MSSKRTSRIQLMFDDEELAALDEWRFSRRMPSRAAAMRALMRFGLKLDVDVDDMGIDPATVASNKIGVVGGVDIDPERELDELLSDLLGDQTIALAREFATERKLTLKEALHQACAIALDAEKSGLGPSAGANSDP